MHRVEELWHQVWPLWPFLHFTYLLGSWWQQQQFSLVRMWLRTLIVSQLESSTTSFCTYQQRTYVSHDLLVFEIHHPHLPHYMRNSDTCLKALKCDWFTTNRMKIKLMSPDYIRTIQTVSVQQRHTSCLSHSLSFSLSFSTLSHVLDKGDCCFTSMKEYKKIKQLQLRRYDWWNTTATAAQPASHFINVAIGRQAVGAPKCCVLPLQKEELGVKVLISVYALT